ncbi:unnamed protein product [Cladocopium goreaui]|uniref:Uncharacterized protein n=1 Tax=Cladocopium goreaui TaxID=2562237 RepID=A0A9P1C7D2_9DINO|nr:unnamed protein product [Cladocopium goreaui]
MLEGHATQNRQESCDRYCRQVICNLSDQGTEMKLADLHKVNMDSLSKDVQTDLSYPNLTGGMGGAASQSNAMAHNLMQFVPMPLDDDTTTSIMRPLAAAGAEAEVGVLGGNIAAGREVPQDSHSTVSDPQYLFPNSFKVTGIKHVCDNLVGAILDSLPQWKPLQPRLQALDKLLATVTWRERYVATCLGQDPDRLLVENWAGDRLRSLRWQVVTNFCKDVARQESQDNMNVVNMCNCCSCA